MKIKIVFVLLIFTAFTNAQNLDSLFNVYAALHGYRIDGKHPLLQSDQPIDHKCGFGISAQLYENYDRLTSDQQAILNILLGRPDKHTSIVSPSGYFRIHYDTTGYGAPNYFPELTGLSQSEIIKMSVDSLAAALDSAYNFEINVLGYQIPVTDGNDGGDDRYDVYIIEYGQGYYGSTEFTASNQQGFYPSYILIDNDMAGVTTHGIAGAKVTAAHEFHHAIQIGAYGWLGSSQQYIYEMTSTAMEEFVYDEVNDYYQYLQKLIRQPSISLVENGPGENYGYRNSIYYIYLHQRFLAGEGDWYKGHVIFKMVWELIRDQKSISVVEALTLAHIKNGTAFEYEFNKFGAWLYFTGKRTIAGKYFEEARNYTEIQLQPFYKFEEPGKQYSINDFKPISNTYLFFDLSYSGFNDTLVSIISNGNINGAMSTPLQSSSFIYNLFSENRSGSTHIIDSYYSLIESGDKSYFREINIYNDFIASGGELKREEIDYVYPQPFAYSKHNLINIPTVYNSLGYADVNIYTTGMNLVYRDKLKISTIPKIVVMWNGRDDNGNKLPTGVYIYVTNSDDKVKKGKLVIYND